MTPDPMAMARALKSATVFLPSLEGGGAERCMVVVANELARSGVSVALVLGRAQGTFLRDVEPAVRIVDLGADAMPRALWGMVRHLRRSRPDAVLSAMSHANVVAALAHRIARSRARLVLSEHAHFSSVLVDFPGPRMAVTRRLMRLTYPWADRIVTVSHGVAQDLLRHVPLAPAQLVTIYNPVVGDRLQRLAREAPAHPWLRQREVPVIVAAGRLIAQKDFATLVDAFAQLRAQRRARLVILGEGGLRGALLARARERGVADDVDLPGFEDNPFAAMRAASLFVVSSRFEGLSCVLVEAMACGTRVVSTDCPSGPAEVLEQGRWGRLVPVGNAQALAAAMAASLDDPAPPPVEVRARDFSDAAAAARYLQVLSA